MLPILFIYKHIMNGGNLLKKLFLTYILIIIIISLLIPSGKNNYLSIHTIDVGQGDSILIQTPNSKNILIDGGDDNSHNIVSSYLKKQNVKRIDYIIATHFDSDHIGGLDNIIDKLNGYINNILSVNKSKLDIIKSSIIFKDPSIIYQEKLKKNNHLIEKLDILNPLNSLKRGYSITKKDNKCINSIKNLNKNDNINIRLYDGNVEAKILEVENG